jgi:hypothetical protein
MEESFTRMTGIIPESEMTGHISIDNIKMLMIDAIRMGEIYEYLESHLKPHIEVTRMVNIQNLL